MVTGGGTGGHVTPIRYVTAKFKQVHPKSQITYIGQKGDRFAALLDKEDSIGDRYYISAGKYRRYPRPLWQTIIDVKTWAANFIDFFKFLIGSWQAWRILGREKPDVLFSKGGFVSVPVGLAAKWRKVPIVTHDSDIIPGLANKMVGKWATVNCVGHKHGDYPYHKDKVKFTGTPINPIYFKEYSQESAAKKLKVKNMILVVGGSLGAQTINDAMLKIAPAIVEHGLSVTHIVGDKNIDEFNLKLSNLDLPDKYEAIDFVSDPNELIKYFHAANVVVSRAGATFTSELAALKKPTIIIPGSQLADQKKNALSLKRSKAALVLSDSDIEDHPSKLLEAIKDISDSKAAATALSKGISKYSYPNSAEDITSVITEVANG